MLKVLMAIVCVGATLTGTAAHAAGCAGIVDNKERLACYDKIPKPNPKKIESSQPTTLVTEAHRSFRNEIETTFLRAGISAEVYIDHGPALAMQMYLSKALVFNLIEKLDILSKAKSAGFTEVRFQDLGRDGQWIFYLDRPSPWCSRGLCF